MPHITATSLSKRFAQNRFLVGYKVEDRNATIHTESQDLIDADLAYDKGTDMHPTSCSQVSP